MADDLTSLYGTVESGACHYHAMIVAVVVVVDCCGDLLGCHCYLLCLLHHVGFASYVAWSSQLH
jgi:hypothetical protein